MNQPNLIQLFLILFVIKWSNFSYMSERQQKVTAKTRNPWRGRGDVLTPYWSSLDEAVWPRTVMNVIHYKWTLSLRLTIGAMTTEPRRGKCASPLKDDFNRLVESRMRQQMMIGNKTTTLSKYHDEDVAENEPFSPFYSIWLNKTKVCFSSQVATLFPSDS